MKRGIFWLILALPVAFLSVSLHCELPDNPADPSKTSITAVFRNDESVIFENSVVNTVGRPLNIGTALHLPKNFDSISLVIKENDIVTVDTIFKTFQDEYFFDTVWYT
jgi:hypothetical protein